MIRRILRRAFTRRREDAAIRSWNSTIRSSRVSSSAGSSAGEAAESRAFSVSAVVVSASAFAHSLSAGGRVSRRRFRSRRKALTPVSAGGEYRPAHCFRASPSFASSQAAFDSRAARSRISRRCSKCSSKTTAIRFFAESESRRRPSASTFRIVGSKRSRGTPARPAADTKSKNSP